MNDLSQFLVKSILEDEITANNDYPNVTEETLHISKEVIEEWVTSRLTTILKEASKTGGFLEVDDGPNFFFRDFRVFDKVSRRRAEQIGYEVVKQIMDASFQDLTVYPEYPTGPVKSVTPFPAGVIGKVTATNQKDFATPRAYDLWFRHARRVATIVGYTLVREKDVIERRLAVGNLDDIYDDETAKEPSSVNESSFFTKDELGDITNDIMSELGGLMIGYAGKDDIQKKQSQLKKLRKKLDKTTPNYPAIKEEYDKLEFYLNYYKNLSPSGFTVKKTKDTIIISPTTLKEGDMGGEPYTVDIEDLTINNTNFRDTKWTGNKLQMTVMDIPNGQDIGLEVHTDGDQFIRVESGEGEVHMGESKEKLDYIKKIKDDTAIFIPAGYWHNIKNTSTSSLKLYVIYAPVEHKRGRVDVNKPIQEIITEANSNLKLNIPKSVRTIHSAFKKNGKKLYIVGGAVRDAILGKTPKDFDLATDAKPDEVIDIAKKNGLKYTEVGKAFGVVVIDDMEIATFRADIGKGRRPDRVEYTDIYGDVKRRDLTINALFYDLDKSEIVDLVGGIKDLQKNKIRTVGNAIDRFDEDPLRKLRAIRFAARLGGKLDKGTLEAIVADPSLSGVSEERIRDEFLKSIQSAKSVKEYLKVMSGTKLLHQCFPNMIWKSSDFIEEKNPILLIAYLFRRSDSGTLYKQLMKLKYTNDEASAIRFLVDLTNFTADNVFKMKRQQQNTALSDNDIIKWGKLIGKDFRKFVKFKLSVSGNDVMKMGFSGKDIGIQVSKMEADRYINEDITIPVNVGDTILTGRFKNKKTKVNTIGKDEHGMPTVNGRKVVNFRKEKDEITEAPIYIHTGLKLIAQNTIDGVKEDWWYIVKKVEGAIGNLTYYLQPLNSKQNIVTVRAKSPAEFYAKVMKK
jgi:tRNA nucleotidyltransferase/poly(A) polymerase/mannose-6-phosphate isomerase-like protein (cupin superfamily)